ncbi:MAG: hypothetical protein JST00_04140 [Deltaproteobacteria bacterium]|nr:hypothetical protein [Deltaproteobacteria bacterium]
MSTPTLPSPGFSNTCKSTSLVPRRMESEAPSTVRCVTEHPRSSLRHDERSAIASMKCNIDFLQAVLGSSASALALDALADLQTAVSRLEMRVRPAYTLLPPRGHR